MYQTLKDKRYRKPTLTKSNQIQSNFYLLKWEKPENWQ